MWFYTTWVPIAILYYLLAAFVSRKANLESESYKWFIILIVINAVGIWPFVARYSKNLLFDAVFFDVIVFFAYYAALIYSEPKPVTHLQYAGLLLVLIGMVLFKLR